MLRFRRGSLPFEQLGKGQGIPDPQMLHPPIGLRKNRDMAAESYLQLTVVMSIEVATLPRHPL